jgi:hypothetical protein
VRARHGRSRRRSPELQAGLDRLKGEVAGRPPEGDGPMVARLLDLAERHLAKRRASGPPPEGKDPKP